MAASKTDYSWEEVVGRIRTGDPDCVEYLCRAVAETSRSRIRRRVDHHLVEDKLHDVVVSVLEAIHTDELREPGRLMGFVSTVARRRVAKYIRSQMNLRRRRVDLELSEWPAREKDSPEATALERDRLKTLTRLLRRLHPRDREILTRFYLDEQPLSDICREMRLSRTQFRLFKSRALARCGEAARRQRARSHLGLGAGALEAKDLSLNQSVKPFRIA